MSLGRGLGSGGGGAVLPQEKKGEGDGEWGTNFPPNFPAKEQENFREKNTFLEGNPVLPFLVFFGIPVFFFPEGLSLFRIGPAPHRVPKPMFWAGYFGILPGYPGDARKVGEKEVRVQFSSPFYV